MRKVFLSTIFSIAVTVIAAVSANAQTVSGSIGNVARGGSVRGTVVLSIPGGLHVNSRNPNSKYAIPTTVTLFVKGAKVSAVSYPRGVNRKFQFSEDTLNVYEGRANFGFTLTVPAGYKGNSVNVRAVVRYQACTDEVCYAPKSKEITLTARIR